MPFYDPQQRKAVEIAPGAVIRPMWGDKVMMVHITLEPGAVISPHSHPHEQAGIVLEGEFDLTIAGEKRRVKRGDAYLVPSNVKHLAEAAAGKAIALDIFSPPREDFIDRLRD